MVNVKTAKKKTKNILSKMIGEKKQKKITRDYLIYKEIKKNIKKLNEKLNTNYDKVLIFDNGKKINADYVIIEEEKDNFGNKKQYVVYSYYNVKRDKRIERRKPLDSLLKIYIFGYNKEGYFNKLFYSKYPSAF
jgi:hypothetical protein